MPPQTDVFTLESHLWQAANILRGSPLDRAEEKNLTTASVARMNLLLHGMEDF